MPAASLAAIQSPPTVSQTAIIFGALAFGFAFWVTIRGDLGKWLGLFGLGGTARAGAAPGGGIAPAAAGLPGLPALPALGAPASATLTPGN